VTFYKIDSAELTRLAGTFDLVYTHHVLEHVYDLASVLEAICTLVKPGGTVLHIAPCANAGSLEYKISQLTGGGNDGSGRFCCDDSSHVRRLTSEVLNSACREHGVELQKCVFANQFWGGIDYISGEFHSTLFRWLHPRNGMGGIAKLVLAVMMVCFCGLSLLRRSPAYIWRKGTMPRGIGKRLLYFIAFPCAVVLYPISILVEIMIRSLREYEWKKNREAENGSEMYCVFKRSEVEAWLPSRISGHQATVAS
jgi:SAM-dependent methyltransferase